MSKLSVIVPCYNAQDTIEKCVNSILGQTLLHNNELEIILVNDASTDNTAALLEQYEHVYPDRVMVVYLSENSGQGTARNVGLQYASGDYVGFVDADDYVDDAMYETLLSIAIKNDCDMAGGGVLREESHTAGSTQCSDTGETAETIKIQKIADNLQKYTAVYVHTKEERRQLLLNGTAVSFAARIYRRSFLLENELFFPEHILYEDNYWQSAVNAKIGSYIITDHCFYHYIYHESSSTQSMSMENLKQSMQIQTMLMDKYESEGLLADFSEELYAKFLKSYCVMNLLSAYLAWQTIPEELYLEMLDEISYRMATAPHGRTSAHERGNKSYAPTDIWDYKNPYLWKCDLGLMADLFCRKLDEKERGCCMEQYKKTLEKGQIDRWQYRFALPGDVFFEKARKEENEYRELCYQVSKNAATLKEEGSFEEQTAGLLLAAKESGKYRARTRYLEQMLARDECFYRRLEKDSPFLIYGGDETCYDVLDGFAHSMADALRACGKEVEWYDIGTRGAEGLLELTGKTYQAIIGFQTWIFSVKLQDGRNVHDLIHGPKFHFIFDHPLWMKEHLENAPRRCYILTHGKDYQAFVERFLADNIEDCFLLPPAGIRPCELRERECNACGSTIEGTGCDAIFDDRKPGSQKTETTKTDLLDITFIGTWYDYRERLAYIKNTKGDARYIANRFLLVMKKEPNLTAEAALTKALSDYEIKLPDESFKELLFEFKQVVFAIMTYYREKVIRVLLEAGLTIHVYGDSWKKSPFSNHPGLICHPQVSLSESMEVWSHSKISLNIMSWHKGGFTERIANMLLAETLAVSDCSTYLEEHFTDGKDIVLFDLEHIDELPERLKYYLSHEKERERVAANGQRKALTEHTWEQRARELLDICANIAQ